MTRTEMKKVQRALRGLGMYWGRIDGIKGPKTTAAVVKFQSINGLVPDGIAGPKTLAAMFPRPMPSRDTDSSARARMDSPRQKDVREYYGRVGRNQTKIKLPYPMRLAWDTDVIVTKMTCHRLVAEPMEAIFQDTLDHYGLDEVQRLGLDMYGGCLNVRKMRGGTRYSMHSWGIAVDMDPGRNQFRWAKNRARLARVEYDPFWKIVEKHGATSLGREKNFDWMHFQFARL
ncbi:MAG: hypothetical protein GY746_07440 [Gammaproteobacteria bacterium]|nr:hypothetical protein [Gammaproteobacteria bacterium]